MAFLVNEEMVVNNGMRQCGPSVRVGKKQPREAVFECSCGARFVASVGHIRTGHTTSCGCKKLARSAVMNKKHGLSQTALFQRWHMMVRRCTDQRIEAYKNYGGRGITVCDRWMVFENFVEDMGFPDRGMTLERIDNDKGYSKENCCWAPRKTQSRNKRTNRMIEHNGKTQCVSDWEDELGFTRGVLRNRLNRGITFEVAVQYPKSQKRKR